MTSGSYNVVIEWGRPIKRGNPQGPTGQADF